MKAELIAETILCLKNNKKVFLNDSDFSPYNTCSSDCPKDIVYDKKIIAYEGKYLSNESVPPIYANIVCYDNKGNIIWTLKPDLSLNSCWDYKDSFSMYFYDDKLEIDNWSGYRYSVDLDTGQATFMHRSKN